MEDFDKLLDSLPAFAAEFKSRLRDVTEREAKIAQRLQTVEKREKACRTLERNLTAREKAIKDAGIADKEAHTPKITDEKFQQRKKWFESNMAKMNKLKNELTKLLAEAKVLEAAQKQQAQKEDAQAKAQTLNVPPPPPPPPPLSFAPAPRHSGPPFHRYSPEYNPANPEYHPTLPQLNFSTGTKRSLETTAPAAVAGSPFNTADQEHVVYHHNEYGYNHRPPQYNHMSPVYVRYHSQPPPPPSHHSFDQHSDRQPKRRKGDRGYDNTRNNKRDDGRNNWKGRNSGREGNTWNRPEGKDKGKGQGGYYFDGGRSGDKERDRDHTEERSNREGGGRVGHDNRRNEERRNGDSYHRNRHEHNDGYQGRHGERNEQRGRDEKEHGSEHGGGGTPVQVRAEEVPRKEVDKPLLNASMNPPQHINAEKERERERIEVGSVGNGIGVSSMPKVSVSRLAREPQEEGNPPGVSAPPSALPGGILPEPLPAKRGPMWGRAVPN